MPRRWILQAAVAGSLVFASAAVHAQEPALDYLQHCAGCHRLDGAGSARNEVPDMRGVIGHFMRLATGRAFLVQVAGVAQAPLANADLAALLNWILPTMSAPQMPNEFVPYSSDEVAALRRTRPADIPAMRQGIARQLAAMGYYIPDYSLR